MDNYNTIEAILKSDLKWCLVHQNDKDQKEPDNKFNSGYCLGRINLVRELLAEIEVLRMRQVIANEDC